jgi:tripeptidyl-peptidase I
LSYSAAKDWISVNMPVSSLERLLQTKYSIFAHEDGTWAVRTPEWSLPTHLHEHIDMISPTNSFFRPRARRSNRTPIKVFSHGEMAGVMSLADMPSDPTVPQACNVSAVTPLCLRTLYGTVNYKPQVPGKNRVGLTDYLGESNNRSDVRLFLQNFRPDAVSAASSFKVTVINNGSNNQQQENATALAAGTELEGNLDAETIIGIDYPTPLEAFTTGGSPPYIPDDATTSDTNEPYLAWVQYALQEKNVPQVISTSYDDDEQTVPPSYAKKVCDSFAQLGARGVSLLFASGDDGVGAEGKCFSNTGSKQRNFLPEFPSSCPYVTSVGATKNFNPEVAAYDPSNGFASGGGFSNYFPRPAYQNKVVPPYVASLKGEFDGLYNKTGRAYPDISAQGQRYVTVWNGTAVGLDGTSAATPCAAAVLSLVNDALLAAGKSPLGFLNPWLYSKGYTAFTDVTSGSAIGCHTNGFPAAKGWDPVTGFGTPFFPKIKALALGSN